jgi:hypothetical protein
LLYRNWPRKLLNHLPEPKKRRHLLRRLGAENLVVQPFHLPQDLLGLHHLAFIWPNSAQRAYAAFPVVMSLKRAWESAECIHIIPPGIESFARIACGGDTLVIADLENLSLDDPQVYAVTQAMAGFKAEVSFLLEPVVNPWHLALMALSASKVRCHLGQSSELESTSPYVNLHIEGLPGHPLFAMAQRLEPVLRGCSLLPQGMTWARLQPSKSSVETALKTLHAARINPGNLWAYLPGMHAGIHAGVDIDISQALRRREGSIEVFTLHMLEDHSPEPPPPRIETSAEGVSITLHSLSQLLGITSWLKGAFGPPSPWLYLLSLTEIEIRTWLSASDSDLDLTAFNSRFRLLPTLAG